MSEDYINGLIRAVVSRCTKENLSKVLAKWDRVSLDELSEYEPKGTKDQMCITLQDIAKRDQLTKEIIGDLELAYMQLNSTKKLWRVFNLKGNNMKLNIDARSLRIKMKNSLQEKLPSCLVDGNMGLFSGSLWFRFHINTHIRYRKGAVQTRNVYKPSSSVYLITFPETPIFMMSQASVRDSRVVLQSLVESTNSDTFTDAHLSGHHIASLADLVLKNNKHAGDRYREIEKKENPLVALAVRKRKIAEPEAEFEDTSEIKDETRPAKRQRREILAKTFGSGEQPLLEKLDYKFDIQHAVPGNTPLRLRAMVRLEGKAAVDGVCSLALNGYSKLPLPRHLSSVVSMGQNSFSLKDKT